MIGHDLMVCLPLYKRPKPRISNWKLAMHGALTALASLLLIVSSVCTTARLALHFDINKTIIMIDSGMATPIQHVLNSILADSACGQGSHEQPLVWVWDGLDPEWNKCPRGRDVKGLSPTSRMTYAAYLSHVRGVARPVRREHILRFTHAGEPGQQHLHRMSFAS